MKAILFQYNQETVDRWIKRIEKKAWQLLGKDKLCSHCVIFLSEDIHLPLYTDTFPAS
jgi:methionyl-tRNA synthetase